MYKFIVSKTAYWKPAEIKIKASSIEEAIDELNEILLNYDWGTYHECEYVLEDGGENDQGLGRTSP